MAFWVPLLLMAAAAGASAAGNAKVKSASNRAMEQELARQRKFSDSQKQEFSKSLRQNSLPEAQSNITQGQTQRLQDYEQAQQIPYTNTPQVTGKENVRTLVDTAQMRQGHRARAKLGGYDTWLLDNAVKNLRTSQQQSLINDASQRSQALLGMDLQGASQAGDGWQTVSSLLGAAGSLYGLSGGGQTGASLTPQATSLYNASAGPTTLTGAAGWSGQVPNWLGETNYYGMMGR